MAKKEFEVARSILGYAAACIADGDWPALREMGIGPKEAEALKDLTLAEMAMLERRLSGHMLHVHLDRAAFWAVMGQIRHDADHRRQRMEFVELDAPADMMQSLFGMGPKEYSFARRVLGAPAGVGRPVEPTEEEARAVWLAWEELGIEPGLAAPAIWRRLAERTGLPLRMVWRVTRRWCDGDGGTAAPWPVPAPVERTRREHPELAEAPL